MKQKWRTALGSGENFGLLEELTADYLMYNPQAVFPIYCVMRVNKQPAASGYWKKQRPRTGVEAEWDPDNGRYKLDVYKRQIEKDEEGTGYVVYNWGTFPEITGKYPMHCDYYNGCLLYTSFG